MSQNYSCGEVPTNDGHVRLFCCSQQIDKLETCRTEEAPTTITAKQANVDGDSNGNDGDDEKLIIPPKFDQ